MGISREKGSLDNIDNEICIRPNLPHTKGMGMYIRCRGCGETLPARTHFSKKQIKAAQKDGLLLDTCEVQQALAHALSSF